MAIESVGNTGASGLSPYGREPVAPRFEPAPLGQANAVETQTNQAVTQALPGSGSAPAGTATKEELEKAVKKVNEFVGNRNSDIQFSTDSDTGMTIVKVIDRSSKELIRQIPSEEMVQIAKALDKLQGLLIRQQA